MREKEDLITLNIAGITPLAYKELLEKHETLQAVRHNILVKAGSEKRKKIEKEVEKELHFIKKYDIKLLTLNDNEYPASLKYTSDPPFILYVKGNLSKEDQIAVAVVGCRKPTVYGKVTTEKITGELSNAGFTIVSGLARGIDTIAHKKALENKGRTIAVLGSGLLNVYPSENKKLALDIEKNGAVVSEFSLFTKPEKFNFPRRNRIISGLSLGTIVMEAGAQSGALITARFALEQGREVFAVPGNIDSVCSRGTNNLIKQYGAKLIESYEDILEELKNILPEELVNKAGQSELKNIVLSDEENKVYCLLSNEPVDVDELAKKSNLSINVLLSVLVSLEIKGFIKQYPGKVFVRI